MKVVLIALLLTASLFARAQTAVLPAACGPKDATFDVKLDKPQHTIEPPESGKARIFFVYDSGAPGPLFAPSFTDTRVGIDGAWAGAARLNSYLSVSIEPGEHHVCAALWYSRLEQIVALAHLQAEAGRSYFYRVRLVKVQGAESLEIDSTDRDEAKFLIDTFPLSISRRKK
jgi:hypothetical protein